MALPPLPTGRDQGIMLVLLNSGDDSFSVVRGLHSNDQPLRYDYNHLTVRVHCLLVVLGTTEMTR
jgi:hypothetical protein